ncbi:hypothetical protein Tcan_14779 [Toxocara canis]|uniref:Uncharacterized protein n=1 Tax=Toxocara canis TaxID=6265 RepID=A0A0B2UUY4_TOXCA|nr:hypothetical protein Tcan_14779 [Toxocara canis]
MNLIHCTVLLVNLQCVAMEYFCGPNTNMVVQMISKWFTRLCDQLEINNCCYNHDVCYDNCAVTQNACDSYFCDCLRQIPTNFFCRNIVQASHCTFAQIFGKPYKCSNYMGRPQRTSFPYPSYRDPPIRPKL